MLCNRLCGLFVFSILLVSSSLAAPLGNSDIDFSTDYERIFQIRVVSPDAGGKSSIGSGFQATADGLIVTNYHVVSRYINAPDEFQIKYMTHSGELGQLELVDFDIISDLAVLQHPEPSEDYFRISNQSLEKGDIAYALGNPGDWGIVMVPGPTNGLVEHSYEKRILFSGSLNAGMSGGPSLNSDGDLIGVNVATAGSQLSFLVPSAKVSQLLERARQLDAVSFQQEIARQLKDWQRPRIQELIGMDWPQEDFLERPLFGEIRTDIQCWGGTNESNEERTIARVSKTCEAGDYIYLAYNLDVGQIRFSFKDMKPVKLNASQFARSIGGSMSADNRSAYKYSTNYRCEKDFIEGPASDGGGYHRIVTCIRAYKKLPGLYDSLLLVHEHARSGIFQSHLSLSALEPDQIQALNKRFVERSL
ncbi:hypothetical protein AB833_28400 [Chromatiales bacterium (ex Bugula neritina AB1)]|nr:hypothetical protein AB833_28400 [Chromatiales bacterium (ex Bugula neritina AB1)]